MTGYRVSPLSIDLARFHRRSLASLYSNLVTRPTGRAIRVGVEKQISGGGTNGTPCISILDFSQVRVLDFSCADEVVAKLLLRFRGGPGRAEVYFLARGLQPHHEEAIEAVLERHGLRLAAEVTPDLYCLLGSREPLETACWDALARRGRANAAQVAGDAGVGEPVARTLLTHLVEHRVAVPFERGVVCALPELARAS
ncbi:MAG: hypothetical protein ACREKN_00255 [Longimicrobiaceae bacterium]